MAGHSKWANIKHRKANQDAKRGKIFTKLIREITVAAREGGPDADSNPRLRAAIDKALSNNMKRDTIDKAIERGSGQSEGVRYETIRYEGYASGGVAVLVDCLTDNKQRTVADVRHLFSKHGGNLGTDGSVAYMFKHQGVLIFPDAQKENQVLEVALQHNAEDVRVHDDESLEVTVPPQHYETVKEALEKEGLSPEYSDIIWDAEVKVALAEDQAKKVGVLVELLEDLDDVQSVYTNLEN